MKIKEGACLKNLNPFMRAVLIEADNLWREVGEELVVTCGLDGTHSAGSLHYYGRAVDLRTNYFTEAKAKAICTELARRLHFRNDNYDVVFHKTHIHCEYDVGGW